MHTKSKSLRKVFVRTPGGKTVERRKFKVGTVPHCPITGQQLPGIAKNTKARRKAHKSANRPARPFGGMLSSWASRRMIINKARSE